MTKIALQQFLQSYLEQRGVLGFNFTNKAKGEDALSVIYITDDPNYNELTLTICNNRSESVTLSAVDDLENTPPENFPLLVQLTGALSEEEIKKIQLSDASAEAWTLAHKTIDDQPIFALAPKQSVALKDQLSIGWTHVTPSAKDNTQGAIHVCLLGQYRWQTGFALQYPPTDLNKSLLSTVRFEFAEGGGHHDSRDVIYICDSGCECTENLDDNSLILSFQNNSGKPLENGKNTQFSIWFPVSDSEKGALCTSADLLNIEIALEQSSKDCPWEISSNTQAEYRIWNFKPKNTNILGKGADATVQFAIAKIMSHLPAGETLMYIAWNNVPKYNDGITALPIYKGKARPTIKKFELVDANNKPISRYTAYRDPLMGTHWAYDVYGAHQWKLNIERIEDDTTTLLSVQDDNTAILLSCSRNGEFTDPNLVPNASREAYVATLSSINNS